MATLDEIPTTFEEARLEAFADRMTTMLNEACTALLASIGHQTGLFAALNGAEPLTSQEAAQRAGLDERYVREWLNGMTTARVVEYDAATHTYSLPTEHGAWLVDEAGAENLARVATFIPMLAEVEQGIVHCFRAGGGLSYADYPRFHALMAEDSAAVFDSTLVQRTIPLVEGLDRRLKNGIDVADIGCGSGRAINVLARGYPNSRFCGLDFSEEAVEAARAEAAAWGLANATFEVCDVATLDRPGSFDLVTAFDAIHDQAHPAQVLAAVSAALRADGCFLMVDIHAASAVEDNLDLPLATFMYTVSTMHCMTVSLGLDGDGLGTMWGEELATRMLGEAGFADVAIHSVEGDPFNSYFVARRG